MRDLWRRLVTHLARHAPAELDFLNPPASKVAIRRAEAELGLSLPTDLAASLQVHNGQPQLTGYPPYPIPLVPELRGVRGGRDVRIATWAVLAPLDLIVSTMLTKRPALRPRSAEEAAMIRFRGPVRRDGSCSWIAFANPGSGDQLGLDLNPPATGRVGHVHSIVADSWSLCMLAPSYQAWFERLVERYESGRYVIAEQDGCLTAVDKRRRARAERGAAPERRGT